MVVTLEPMEQTLVDAISKINQRAVAQEPGCPLPYISHTVITKGTCLHHSPMSVPKTNINRIHTITKMLAIITLIKVTEADTIRNT